MIVRGIISSFDGEKGSIILSNGQRQEFYAHDWKDSSNTIKIGLEVIYEEENSLTKLRVPNEEEKKKLLADEKKQNEAHKKIDAPTADLSKEGLDETRSFTCLDEHLHYYVEDGYKCVKDAQTEGGRTAVLRKYVMGDFEEIILQEKNAKVSTKKILNGEEVN